MQRFPQRCRIGTVNQQHAGGFGFDGAKVASKGQVCKFAHRAGKFVHVWTIDDPAEIHRLLDLGVDGIMTDRPAVLRDVMRERGVWHE